jgi:hypothetical protein
MSFIASITRAHDFPAGLVLQVLDVPESTYNDWRARRVSPSRRELDDAAPPVDQPDRPIDRDPSTHPSRAALRPDGHGLRSTPSLTDGCHASRRCMISTAADPQG